MARLHFALASPDAVSPEQQAALVAAVSAALADFLEGGVITGVFTEGALTREERELAGGAAARIAGEVLAECDRQYGEEGYNPKHDAAHAFSEFALAAAAYSYSAAQAPADPHRVALEWLWPWWRETFKPKDPRRDLIRGLALGVRAVQALDRETIDAADREAV